MLQSLQSSHEPEVRGENEFNMCDGNEYKDFIKVWRITDSEPVKEEDLEESSMQFTSILTQMTSGGSR